MSKKIGLQLAQTNNAAKDDVFSGSDNAWLTEDGSLTGSLAVLANDPRSASLYSVLGTKPDGGGPVPDLLDDEFTVQYDGTDYTGYLTANDDGTIDVDLSSLAGHLELAEGEVFEVNFCYAARMGKQGALSIADVTLQIVGTDGSGEAPLPDESEGDPPTLLSNGGFEDGDLTGWSTLGNAVVTGEYTFESTTVTPTGSFLAGLSTDPVFAADGPSSASAIESFLGIGASSIDGYEGSAMSRAIDLVVGEELSFDFFFDTQDAGFANDFAFFTIVPNFAGDTPSIVELVNADSVAPTGDTGVWQHFVFTATATGNYTIGVGVADYGDGIGTSLLYVDNFAIG